MDKYEIWFQIRAYENADTYKLFHIIEEPVFSTQQIFISNNQHAEILQKWKKMEKKLPLK